MIDYLTQNSFEIGFWMFILCVIISFGANIYMAVTHAERERKLKAVNQNVLEAIATLEQVKTELASGLRNQNKKITEQELQLAGHAKILREYDLLFLEQQKINDATKGVFQEHERRLGEQGVKLAQTKNQLNVNTKKDTGKRRSPKSAG